MKSANLTSKVVTKVVALMIVFFATPAVADSIYGMNHGVWVTTNAFIGNTRSHQGTAHKSRDNSSMLHVSIKRSEVVAPHVVVVESTRSYWVHAPNRFASNRLIRVTVPTRIYLSSWDVGALEQELERLGVKVKPKPVPPKPGIYSG